MASHRAHCCAHVEARTRSQLYRWGKETGVSKKPIKKAIVTMPKGTTLSVNHQVKNRYALLPHHKPTSLPADAHLKRQTLLLNHGFAKPHKALTVPSSTYFWPQQPGQDHDSPPRRRE